MKKISSIALLSVLSAFSFSADYVSQEPMSQKAQEGVRDCRSGNVNTLPMITWGADAVTLFANGNSLTTQPNSAFADAGLSVKLEREDVFSNQVKSYLRCDTPWIRGTMGQLGLISDMMAKDPRTELVPVLQLSWSNGGDALVVNGNIKSVKDLKGKSIALMADGPHIDYLVGILADEGLSLSDVTLKFTKDLTGDGDSTPVMAMLEGEVEAAMTIIPDALALTSDGNVGTGAEGSVKGATILVSTKSASRVIADVYAVRKDYFDANQAEIQKFVHAWLKAEETFVKSESSNPETLKTVAKYLLDAESAIADAEGLILDAETAGYAMNRKFFTEAGWPRSFERLNSEIQSNYQKFGLVSAATTLSWANWNYDQLKAGITTIVAEKSGFSDRGYEALANSVTSKAAAGSLDDNALFSFQINFQPNSDDVNAALYTQEFQRVIELSAKYAGAVITVEGHADPLNYLKKRKQGEGTTVLSRIRQSARNTSLSRSNSVRDEIISLAASQGFTMDSSQFVSIGHGFEQPLTGMGSDNEPLPPKSEQAWLSNMRVVFKIVNIEAEASSFELL